MFSIEEMSDFSEYVVTADAVWSVLSQLFFGGSDLFGFLLLHHLLISSLSSSFGPGKLSEDKQRH